MRTRADSRKWANVSIAIPGGQMMSLSRNVTVDGLRLRVAAPVRVAGLMATLILISSASGASAGSTLGSAGTSANPSGSISTKVNETVTPATLTDRTGLCCEADNFSDCETTWPG